MTACEVRAGGCLAIGGGLARGEGEGGGTEGEGQVGGGCRGWEKEVGLLGLRGGFEGAA